MAEPSPQTAVQDCILLGKTGIQVSSLGIGAWAWGDRLVWSYGRGYSDADIHNAFKASIEAGVTFFDTAEAYGSGRSERLLGSFLKELDSQPVIATKFMPYPWRLSRGMLRRALKNSLERLDLASVDLYQIHWPFPPVPIETWVDALADVHQEGLVRAVGVSNYSLDQMRRAVDVLSKRGIPLASNQVEYHLLNRKVEFNGLLQACRDAEITLIAYSPLAQGVLTGKYSPETPPPGIRGRRYSRATLQKAQALLRLMREIGRAHEDKSISQVALNWLICKGTLPIPGVKNLRQADDNCGAMGWRLSEEEVCQLDEASRSQ